MAGPVPSPNPLPTTEGVMQGWQPIETCNAKRGEMIIAYRPLAHKSGDDAVALKRYLVSHRHCWESTVPDGFAAFNPTDGACHVTHWMPLPPPPGQNT